MELHYRQSNGRCSYKHSLQDDYMTSICERTTDKISHLSYAGEAKFYYHSIQFPIIINLLIHRKHWPARFTQALPAQANHRSTLPWISLSVSLARALSHPSYIHRRSILLQDGSSCRQTLVYNIQHMVPPKRRHRLSPALVSGSHLWMQIPRRLFIALKSVWLGSFVAWTLSYDPQPTCVGHLLKTILVESTGVSWEMPNRSHFGLLSRWS